MILTAIFTMPTGMRGIVAVVTGGFCAGHLSNPGIHEVFGCFRVVHVLMSDKAPGKAGQLVACGFLELSKRQAAV